MGEAGRPRCRTGALVGGRSCQADYKLTEAGSWIVIATNVKDNTEYQFHFRSDARSTGQYAS
ncbi:hypothetical protein [Streptomyces sp. NPDC006415]|uniref:hypothetical protein n=1 Tax=Streptomyces sp. NPDC006415 TaxID=3155351 RepID=UPI0033A62B06